MAQKYVVKKDDNLLKVAQKTGVSPSEIKTANGIKTLTPGQTIKVPTFRGDQAGGAYNTPPPFQTPAQGTGNGMRDPRADERLTTSPAVNPLSTGGNNPTYFAPTGSFLAGGGNTALSTSSAPFQTPAQGSFVSGSGQVNIPRNPTTGGMLSPEKNAVLPRTVLASGSFYSGAGEVNLTGVSVGQGNSSVDGGAGYNQFGNLQYTAAARPQVPFEQDPAAWRAYWNYSAQHPETVTSVITQRQPTIRELRDAQRRREGYSAWEDGQTQNYSSPMVQPIDTNFYGNNVNTSLSWRVG